jgi:hypothetical protein
MSNTAIKTIGQLKTGTVINFSRPTTADDTNYVVLLNYTDRFGDWTEVLNLSTLERTCYSQNLQITHFWSIVK